MVGNSDEPPMGRPHATGLTNAHSPRGECRRQPVATEPVFTLFAELSDEELLDRVGRLAATERRSTAELVAALAELDRRKLYLGLGHSSLFVYCTRVLHLSEHAAYNRIE